MTHIGLPLLLAAAAAGLDSSGELYSPEGGGFSIRFPGEPKASTQKAKSDVGEVTVEVHTATFATSAGDVFMVSYSDLPEAAARKENRESLLKGVREGARGGGSGKIPETQVNIGEGGNKLTAYQYDFQRGAGQYARLWVLVEGNRLYQIAAVGSQKFTQSKDAERFLNSFRLKK